MRKTLIFILLFISMFTIHSENVDLLINLIDFYISNNNYEKALESIEKGLAIQPENNELKDLKRKALDMKEKDKKDTVPAFDQESGKDELKDIDVEKIIPEKKLLPFTYLSTQEKVKINRILNEAIDLKSRGRNEEAKERFSEVLKFDDLNEQANFYMGQIWYNQNQFEKAKKSFENVLMYHPDNIQAIYWLGLTYMRMQKASHAKSLFMQVIEKEPDNILSYMQIANIYKAEKDLAKAEKFYREALQVDGKLTNIYTNLADLYFDAEVYEKAMNVYREMIKVFPDNPAPYAGIGYIYIIKNEYQNALPMIKNLEGIDPDHHDTLALLSIRDFYSQEHTRAEEHLVKSIDKKPDNRKMYVAVIKVLDIFDEKEYTKKYCEYALRYFPKDVFFNISMGKYHLDRNDYKSAMQYYEEAYKKAPEDKDVLYSLAKIYDKQGFIIDSMTRYRKLISKYPKDPMADVWKNEFRSVYEKYKKEKESNIESPGGSGSGEDSMDYTIPQGF
ncbi:MAG: tetratricopeptide repeat protein [Candidatus Muiribacteriaceae bacterium]